MEKMKVYCKNCKWYIGLKDCTDEIGQKAGYQYVCFPVKIFDCIGNPLWKSCKKLNDDNNCKYYKCKWWKFFV